MSFRGPKAHGDRPQKSEVCASRPKCQDRALAENKGDSANWARRVIMTVFHKLSRAEGPWGQTSKDRGLRQPTKSLGLTDHVWTFTELLSKIARQRTWG